MVRLKFGAKFEGGWMAVVRRGERLDIAHVITSAGKRPQIQLSESFRIERDEADALSRLTQSRALKRYRCATLLSNGDYHLGQLDAPAVPEEERVQAMRWRLKDMVDFPVETAAVAIVDIPVPGGRQANVFAVAAPATRIGERMALFQAAKLRLEAIDIPEMAVRNVAVMFEEENRGLAFLFVGTGDSMLAITYHGELYLARHIDLSAEALGAADADRRQQLLERLVLELQRTLDNFDRQYGFISVSRLIVASEQDSAGLTAALAESLYVPVLAMDLAQVADFATVPELRLPERQAQSLLAIGAALREAA